MVVLHLQNASETDKTPEFFSPESENTASLAECRFDHGMIPMCVCSLQLQVCEGKKAWSNLYMVLLDSYSTP